MTNKEAAKWLTQLLAQYRATKGVWDIADEYYEAVSIACGVLLVDDVLKRGEEPSEED